jgi:hypothetical protein
VPAQHRADWFAEWVAELCYINNLQNRAWCRNNRKAIVFCLGAFNDALWMRRNTPRPDVRLLPALKSPVMCLSFLAVLAAVSLFFALRSPGPADMIVPVPYREARSLVTISGHSRIGERHPTISPSEYRSLKKGTRRWFTAMAFYRPLPVLLNDGDRTAEVTAALTSRNLFDLLDIPLPSPGRERVRESHGAILILSDQAWSKYFDRDPQIVGRVVTVAGRQTLLAGVISASSWRLPGRIDAWVLEDEQSIDALPPRDKGFVLARLTSPALHSDSRFTWQVSVPDDQDVYHRFQCVSLARGQEILAHLLVLAIALLILPATTSLAFGEYPPNRHCRGWTVLRRWIFLALKLALLNVIVFCGSLDLAWISWMHIQPHGLLIGYVLAFRWALIDQRRRCPVCLRVLTNPIRIGRPSQTFLEWYGTELICIRGHGLMHVPEIPTSCYSTQRWLYLDPSWSSLFSQAARSK